jgi:hypothetical protein
MMKPPLDRRFEQATIVVLKFLKDRPMTVGDLCNKLGYDATTSFLTKTLDGIHGMIRYLKTNGFITSEGSIGGLLKLTSEGQKRVEGFYTKKLS